MDKILTQKREIILFFIFYHIMITAIQDYGIKFFVEKSTILT